MTRGMLDQGASTSEQAAWLVPLSGPPLEPIKLLAPAAASGKAPALVLGRHEHCELKLPADADRVSRTHARLSFERDESGPGGGHWRLSDLNSRWGTYVNGVRIEGGREVPLKEGDLVRISPWTFGFSLSGPDQRGVDSVNDLMQMQTLVRSVSEQQAEPLAEDVLSLLLEGAAGIHAAADEAELAQVVLDQAIRGTGLTHAAWLRQVDASGRVEVVASRWLEAPSSAGPIYSRSLLATAARGTVAELSTDSIAADGAAVAQSIIQMHIRTAVCVPLMLGPTIAAYLYLDARGNGSAGPRTLRRGASAFCLALGRMASLALANLKRMDIEKRHALMQAELSAGAEAQRWILPERKGAFGVMSYTGESRPGYLMAGDFFDVIPLPDGRLGVSLGDVTGKGVGASVLMTASQGFLHAALREHGDVARAVTELNAFIYPRRPPSKFVTLWAGVFDPAQRRLEFVDAGHGYALLIEADGTIRQLSGGRNVPVGILDEERYQSFNVELPPPGAGARALIVSDGIIEQTGTRPDGSHDQFELGGLEQFFRSRAAAEADEVAALFDAIVAYAGTSQLADDATALLVRW